MSSQILLSLAVGIFVGGVAGYLGTLMLGRRMALIAGPLGHLTLPGIALALIYGFDISLGAFPFVILGIFFIWLFEVRTKLPMEALTAVIFASGVAMAFLFLPIGQAEAALVGNISNVNICDSAISVVLTALVFLVILKIYQNMVLINISEDLAKSQGVTVKKHNLVYLLLIAVIVALGVKIVGSLLTAALVAIPACSARNLSRNMFQYALGATVIGIVSSSLGIMISEFSGFPTGPLIILANAAIFVISTIFKR
jgi:ABC-type Mn2+/Zn2+ transport system permease subunit